MSARRTGTSQRLWQQLLLLWLLGMSLRVTVLALPPLLPLVTEDLGLSATAVGLASGLPVLLFSIAAVLGSLVLARIGLGQTIVLGLLITAIAGAARGAGHDTLVFFGATFVMGLGIAILQPAIPDLASAWMPGRTALATATFVNGMMVGELAASSLTLTHVLPLTGGSWPASLAFWSLPVGLAVLLFALRARSGLYSGVAEAPAKWWPDWGDRGMWRAGIILGCSGSLYFTSNAFIPGYLVDLSMDGLIAPALATLNGAQIPTSLAAMSLPWLLGRHAAVLVLSGLAAMLAVAGLIAVPSAWTILLGTAAFGVVGAATFILAMSLPPLLAPRGAVGQFSAGVLGIGYALSSAVALLSGRLRDAIDMPHMSLVPLLAVGIVLFASAFRGR